MPLATADANATPESLTQASEKFLIFYSSIVNGRMWCPDCTDVEDLVKKRFSSADDPSALIVFVGDKPTWKSPSNVFRGKPWNIQSVPTILKIQDGKEVGRLVESEVSPGIDEFVRS